MVTNAKLRNAIDILGDIYVPNASICPSYLEKGVERESNKAFNLLNDAHLEGDKYASYAIANFYHESLGDVEHNIEKAIKWYLIAFNKYGNIDGGLEAARIFRYQKKFKEAYEIYKILADEADNHIAHCALGDFYAKGIYLGKDKKKALFHYKKSIEGGNLTAPVPVIKDHLKKLRLFDAISLWYKTAKSRCKEMKQFSHIEDGDEWEEEVFTSEYFRNM